MLYGVDVHDGYQAGLSFATLRQQGYSFAAVKFTQGTGYARDQADEWFGRARAAGLIPGAYHWLNAEPGAGQARWFWRKLGEVGGPEGALIQCDNEDNATWQVTKDWAAEWEQLSGGHPFLMYTGRWWWGPRGWPGASLTPYLWDSRYLRADLDTIPDDPAAFAAGIPADWWRLSDPNNPGSYGYGGWTVATFLQFTSKGDAGQLANNVDLNCTKLTREQLLALTTTGGDMTYEQTDRNVDWATTNRALALLANAPAAVYKVGADTRTELNGLAAALARMEKTLAAIASKVDIEPAELAGIAAAAEAGAAKGATEAADEIAAAVLAQLPPDDDLTQADVEAAVRSVLVHGVVPSA